MTDLGENKKNYAVRMSILRFSYDKKWDIFTATTGKGQYVLGMVH